QGRPEARPWPARARRQEPREPEATPFEKPTSVHGRTLGNQGDSATMRVLWRGQSARPARESGGTGRRAGFRFPCRKAGGFESLLSHRAAPRRDERPPALGPHGSLILIVSSLIVRSGLFLTLCALVDDE